MSDEKMNRFRVSVPKEATQVLEWIENQSNLSYAFLYIIRGWIAKNGTGNVFAQHIDLLPKRGRPSNVLKETVNQMQNDNLQSDIEQTASNDSERRQTLHTSSESEHFQIDENDADDNDFFNFEQNQSPVNTASKSIIDMMNGG